MGIKKINVNVNELYGDNSVSLEFPEGWEVKEMKMEGHDKPVLSGAEIKNALQNPLGTPTLSELAKGKTGRVVIVVDDWHRPTPVDVVIPHVIEELKKAGISDDQILIMAGNGTHIHMTIDAFIRKVGLETVQKYECINHSLFENLQNLGFTSFGTPLFVDKTFVEADLRISIGGIKTHGAAGASGGGKMVLPGVSGLETIIWNHNVVRFSPKIQNKSWMIEGNKERADAQEAARIAGLDFIVNINYNKNRQVIGVHAGDLEEAWLEAVKLGYENHATRIPKEKADIVVENAYPNANTGPGWNGIRDSLRDKGSAVAVHFDPKGNIGFLHSWSNQGLFLNRPKGPVWPVKQAENIIVYNPRPYKNLTKKYTDKVQWITEWGEVINRLESIHGNDALVYVFPFKLHFNPDKYPFRI